MSADAYEVVDRPDAGALLNAVIATVASGRALRIPVKGKPALLLYHRLAMALRRRGYRLRAPQSPDGKALIAWAERNEA